MGRPARRNKRHKYETTDDRLAAYFGGELDANDLNKKELDISKRVLAIWSIMANSDDPSTTTEIINKHVAAHGGEEVISIRQAYRDYKRAARIFGDLARISVQARWLQLHEFAIKMLKKALDEKDLREANRAIKNLIDITANLKGDDADGDRPSRYVLEIVVDANGTKKEINLDSNQNITDIEFEEVTDTIDKAVISTVEMKKLLEEG